MTLPAKLQNTSASIDGIGQESLVLRSTIVVALVITAVCAVIALAWAYQPRILADRKAEHECTH